MARRRVRLSLDPIRGRGTAPAGDAVQLLVGLVLLPAVALVALAVLSLVVARREARLFFTLLAVALVACLAVGTALAVLALWRQARLAELQNEFVARAGHELRTPLTAIAMFAETLLLGRERGEAERRRLLEALAAETARLRERVDRLLEWGRIESGRRTYAARRLDLRKVARDAARVAGPTLEARRQRLVLDAPTVPVTVVGDREALTDAAINLLANASRYSPEGSRVELGVAAAEGTARLWVADRGVGIPRRELRRIFRRFHRVPGTEAAGGEGGAGLGLAIVRDVVAGHGGRIEVESAPGEGSTFTVVLPLADGEGA